MSFLFYTHFLSTFAFSFYLIKNLFFDTFLAIFYTEFGISRILRSTSKKPTGTFRTEKMGKSDKKEKEEKIAANLEKFEKMSAELDKEKKRKKKKSKDRKREHTPEKEV